jgi:Plavaka transposase
VGAEDFEPAEVRATSWSKINRQLSLNDWDKEEWVNDDAGWRMSDIKISVPFHHLTETPGAREYVAGSLHHRSLVNIICDKISNPCAHAHFHYEPYELLWQPTTDHKEVRVQGELYTSPAFISAHNLLQESPMEPGCDLPCVVVALMFWSDATQLMNFGNAKLWPLYMFFGNESKYRRCTPSCNSCEHVAYFETVCFFLFCFII